MSASPNNNDTSSRRASSSPSAPLSPAARLLAANRTRTPLAPRAVSKIDDPLLLCTATGTSPPGIAFPVSVSAFASRPPSPRLLSDPARPTSDTDGLRQLKTSLRSRLGSDSPQRPRSSDSSSRSTAQPPPPVSSSDSPSSAILASDSPRFPGSPPSPDSTPVPDSPRSPDLPHLPGSPRLPGSPCLSGSIRLPDSPRLPDSTSLLDSPPQPDSTHLPDSLRSPDSTHRPDSPPQPDSTPRPDSLTRPDSPRLPVLWLPLLSLKLHPPPLALAALTRYPTSNSSPFIDITLHLLFLPFSTLRSLLSNSPTSPILTLCNAAHDALGLVLALLWSFIAILLHQESSKLD